MKRRVLIDPGHSEKHPGARGKNLSIHEEDLNLYQAETLQVELENLGIDTKIINPLDDDLFLIGQQAKDFDMFVSLHLNAFDGKEHYTTCMVHSILGKPQSISMASKFAKACSGAIGNPLFKGSLGFPVGVMSAHLGVLRGAELTNCPCCFLCELEFLDDETETEKIKARIKIGMVGGARAIAEFFKQQQRE